MNLGQLALLIRARFLVDAVSFTKVQGLPIFAEELEEEILRVLDDVDDDSTKRPRAVATLTKKDFTSDQEVRWCPGCGDYAILSAVQGFMPELGIEPHKTVFVTGIGCSGRFTYYMDTYGVHGIHGRAPAIATGIATANPDLNVFGRHGRRRRALDRRQPPDPRPAAQREHQDPDVQQPDLRAHEGSVLADVARRARSRSRHRSARWTIPSTRSRLALGAEATFVARTIDNDRQHLTEVLRQAAAHRGTAFVEIYQNCNVFNDGAFDLLREKSEGVHNQIRLEDGQPIIFDEGHKCVIVGDNGRLQMRSTDQVDPDRIVVHDVDGRPSLPFGLAHLSLGPHEPTCIGVFRDFERTVYGEAMYEQLDRATERLGKGDLESLAARRRHLDRGGVTTGSAGGSATAPPR